MKISIISDTHSFFDEQLKKHLLNSNEIWHAGDIGSSVVLDQLEQLTGRLRVVHGNIDGRDIILRSSENELFDIDGTTVLMTHIAGKPPRYNRRVRELISEHRPGLLVCGHSHILKVENDKVNNLLFINPGASGHHGFHRERTMIQFELVRGKPTNMIVIELGKRGKLEA